MLIFVCSGFAVLVGLVFVWSLCRAASEADERLGLE